MDWEKIAETSIDVIINKGLIEKIKNLFKKRKKILLFGSSGVGKTQFINSLTHNITHSINRNNRTKTVEKSKISIDKIPILLIDTPGEQFAQDQLRKKEIADFIKNGGAGIINVVCYGYHEGPVNNILDIKKGKKFNENYLEHKRQKEIEQLSEWEPFIGLSNIEWIITLISKADIWWSNKNKIQNYYELGNYNKIISKMPKKLEHIILPYCSIIEPFYGIPQKNNFGNNLMLNLQNNFLNTFMILLGKINSLN